MSTKREIRSFTATQPFAVRTLANGNKQVSGYAIVWNSPADLGDFQEVCSPQMLTRTLRERPDILALRDHKQELLLGRTSANTLQLRVDSTGLAFTITLPQTAIGDDTYTNVKLRNLTGCSFGFTVAPDGGDSWAVDSQGNVVRTLLDVDLYEVSLTSFPAYQDTSVSARSRAAEMRSTITRSDDDLADDDDDGCDPELDADCDDEGLDDEELNSSETCSCRCERCLTDRCERCIRSECSDPVCYSRGCAMPGQDENRNDRLRVRTLFAHRMKV